jgi:putative oxidoreductase
MNKATIYALPLARLLLSILFLVAGYGKLMNPAGTIAYISSAGLPLPQLGYVIALAAELGGGLLILVGYQTRIIAPLMALFTLATAVCFHNNFADQSQLMSFLKDIAIAGGFLALMVSGAGICSIDNRKA